MSQKMLFWDLFFYYEINRCYEKAVNQLQNFKKIASLKEDTYRKSFNQYKENIISLDQLLIYYNNMLSAQLNMVSALANIGFSKSKIDINNKF